jgi:hypothetical protein
MSNALAIASVTRALLDLLNDGLIDNDVAAALGQAIVVSALPPDRVLSQQQPPGPDPTQLNIFLYHVTRNPGWHNEELPARDSRGALGKQPTLPLDLHYLLTAFGSSDLQSEILLGYAMQLLHETPVLTRAALRTTLTAASVSPQILPAAYGALRAADLAEQVELVKLTPAVVSVDEMSKIWTSLQTRYRTSACYHASVVLIESRRPVRRPLPVLMRGQRNPLTGKDEGVQVRPDLLPSIPTITDITPPLQQLAARLGDVVDIKGPRLTGTTVTARFTSSRERQLMTLATTAGAELVSVQIPTGAGQGGADPSDGSDTDNWRCGLYDVEVEVHTPPAPARLTNVFPLVLAPRIVSVAAATAAAVTTFTVQCAPRIRAGQAVSLVVGTREMPAESFAGPSTDTVQFRGRDFVPGTPEWVRLRVDGIDSLLVDRSTAPPSFSPTDRVVIP